MANGANKDVELLAAYLVVGEDSFKRERTMQRLRARLAARGDLSFNSDTFQGEEASGADIAAACNTMPFASDVRLVEVRGAEKLRRADADALVAYLASPSESTVLALVCEKLAKNTRLYKAVAALGPHAVIDCTPPRRSELPAKVRGQATAHGVTLTPAAAELLVELVGEDMVHLDAELSKLALAHRGGDAVNEHEVAALVGRTAEPKPWELVDALSARNVRQCVNLLERMPSASPHALLPQCTRRVRELMCARAMTSRGTQRQVASELKVPDWKARKIVGWSRNFTDEELRRALVSSADAELAMKSGSDARGVFLEWLVGVAARR